MSLATSQGNAPAPAPAAPAAAPAQAPATRTVITVPASDGTTHRVYTTQDIAALNARKNELSNQITSANSRRREVQSELRRATTAADRTGLEQRLGVLDQRIARLEQDIDENSGQLASLGAQQAMIVANPGHYWSPTGQQNRDNQMPTPVSLILGFIAAVVLGGASGIFRRGKRGATGAAGAPGTDTARRLERMEQAMEAIAIEIERVAEGQRFVTRVMTERPGALGEGQAPMEPLHVGDAHLVDRR